MKSNPHRGTGASPVVLKEIGEAPLPRLDLPIISFTSSNALEKWLEKNHSNSPGIWLRIFKKASGKKTVTYDEALDVALCYGWIDGLVKSLDESSYIQRFTPRRAKSLWSKRNREHVRRLTKAGRMKPAGLKEIAAAKRDGRWKAAYESPRKMTIPADFMKQLSKNKPASAFFKTLDKTNLYSIAWRLNTAIKPQTRERRMNAILAMLVEGKKFH